MDLCNVGEITMNEQLLARKLELVKAEIGEVTYQPLNSSTRDTRKMLSS